MAAFLARRLLLAAVVLAAFSFVSFLLLARLQPPPQPRVLPQYWSWLRGVWAGTSLHTILHASGATPPVLQALGRTAALLALALILVLAFSVVLGTAAARWRSSPLDLLVRGGSYLAWAVPAFLLGLVMQKLVNAFGGPRGLGPFPIAGWPGHCPAGIGLNSGTLTPCPAAGTGGQYALHVLTHVALPALALAVGFVGLHSRYLRGALLDALNEPYIITARAKGLPERLVVLRHALRASLATFIGAVLGDFGAVFGATLAVDWVFQLGGLGTLFINEFSPSTGFFNLYSLEALVLVTAVLVLFSSLLSELAVDLLDPRVRANR